MCIQIFCETHKYLGLAVPVKKKEEMINAILLIFATDPAAIVIDEDEEEGDLADAVNDNIED